MREADPMSRLEVCEARRKSGGPPIYDLLVRGIKEGEAKKLGRRWLVEFGGVAANDSSFTGAVEKVIGDELDRRLLPLLRLKKMFRKNIHELLALRIDAEDE